MKLPNARTANVVVQELDKELLIYDLTTHQARQLNETALIVYRACDGKTTFADLKRRHRFTDDLIYFALDQLRAENLIEGYEARFANVSRRELIRRVGTASLVALPFVTALTAPRAAHAASTRTTCDGTCTCSVRNNDPELIALCSFGLNGSSECPTNIGGCDCVVSPNSNTGTCTVIFV